MRELLQLLGSMKTMAVLMLIFAIAIGYATFIENDYGTMTAKAEVYNAPWFALLLGLLAANLIYNIIQYKMYRKQKFLVFLFHVSFLVILVGAAVTRYIGYEGVMHIREGETSNTMISSDSYVTISVKDANRTVTVEKPILLSKYSTNHFETTVDDLHVKLIDYIPNATYVLVDDAEGKAILNMMITNAKVPTRVQLEEGSFFESSDLVIDFNSGTTFTQKKEVIHIEVKNNQLQMRHPMTLNYLRMDDQTSGELNASTTQELQTRTLYTANDTNFVLRDFKLHAGKKLTSATVGSGMNNRESDALVFDVSRGDTTRRMTVFGAAGVLGTAVTLEFEGAEVSMAYGARIIELPFALHLKDFQLERYPGSMSPASYASEVVLIDKRHNVERPFRIYMNHILNYEGFRFFQSSYDMDEQGTVLSVNKDPGTLITYIGYAMLTIGMFLSPFLLKGRYRKLNAKATKAAREHQNLAAGLMAVLLLLVATPSRAETLNPVVAEVLSFNKEHADRFGRLIVQDTAGRMKPMDTLSLEVVNKIYRSDSMMGLDANQILLGMMMAPTAWREISMIQTSHKEINNIIHLKEGVKTASFSQFFEFPDTLEGYKLSTYVDEATRKPPGKRNKFDKAVLKVDERVNIAYMAYSGALMKIWPRPKDKTHKWFATIEALKNFETVDSEGIRAIAMNYFTAVDDARQSGDWSKADAALGNIEKYQHFYGVAVYPDAMKVKLEIWYNHSQIFERLWPLYFLVGFVLLILSFVKIITPRFQIGWASKSALALLILFFVAHTVGLGIRWYISGHAPWSNGYESMIYIAWATVFAGFIFAKNSPITLASTSILTGLILFVAHLNWMDPQITTLAPVLNSYWLSIHVSMITASYGFLGLGALLGFITLILFIIKNK
ncbi:MAG: cytochrome C biogenesis protein, partial [Sulfurimonas sp.]